MAKVFLAGMAVIDFVLSVDELPTEAEKYRANDSQIVGGGCAANAAVTVARLGGEAALAARLGDDQLADIIIGKLKNENVQTELVHRVQGGRSSFSSIYVDSAGERQIVNFRGEGLENNTIHFSSVGNVSAILVDTRWTKGALAALKIARNRNIPGILDAEAPIDSALLDQASHIAFSRTGLLSISSTNDLHDALAEASAKLKKWVCVTDGADGVYFSSGAEIKHSPAFRVPVKDTLAAGDVWHGAFALRLAEGADEEDAVRFASAVAALKCTKFGGLAGCPNRDSAEAFLKESK